MQTRCAEAGQLLVPGLLLMISLATGGRLPAQDRPVVFDRVAVLPMTGATRLVDQTVVVSAGRIQAIGRAGTVPVPGGARHVDGRGATLLPGLWDSHVHLLTIVDSGASLVDRAEQLFLPGYLANGVTSVRDLGAAPGPLRVLQERMRAPGVVGPRMFTVGQLLGGSNRYAPGAPWNREVQDAADGVRAVDSLQSLGVHAIKVHDFLSRSAWVAITNRAREQGLRVTGHLSPSVSVEDAVGAGQRSIQHVGPELLAMCTDSSKRRVGAFYDAWIAGGPGEFADGSVALWSDRTRTCDATMRGLGARGLTITPTLVHRFVDRAAARAGDGVRSPTAERQCAATLRNWTEVAEAKRQRYRLAIQEFVRAAHTTGITLVAGTDGPHECLPAGTSLVLELEEMVAAGLTPLDAIATATVNAAREAGADSSGTIAAGQRADLILVDGDPAVDIGALRRLRVVVANGVLLDRKALDAMTANARAATR